MVYSDPEDEAEDLSQLALDRLQAAGTRRQFQKRNETFSHVWTLERQEAHSLLGKAALSLQLDNLPAAAMENLELSKNTNFSEERQLQHLKNAVLFTLVSPVTHLRGKAILALSRDKRSSKLDERMSKLYDICIHTDILTAEHRGWLAELLPRVILDRPSKGYPGMANWEFAVFNHNVVGIMMCYSAITAENIEHLIGLGWDEIEPVFPYVQLSETLCLKANQEDRSIRFERAQTETFYGESKTIENWSQKIRQFNQHLESAAKGVGNV